MGLFSKVGKAITGGLTGGIKKGVSSFLGQAAGVGADKLFGSADPYNKHLQRGIQWRVADAKAAGVHPLFALGASIGSPVGTSGSGVQSQVASEVSGGISHGFGAPARAKQAKMAEQTHGAALTESYTRAAANAAAARRDHAAALELNSRVARGTALANVKQDGTKVRDAMAGGPGTGETGVLPPNIPWETSPTAMAEWVEKHYGDLFSWAYGAGRGAYDLGYNIGKVGKPVIRRAYKRSKRITKERMSRDPLSGLY